jgi:putative ABC transport system permease protein
MLGFALLNVIRQARRSLIAVLAIAFGITALIIGRGFIEWNLWYGRESTIHSQLGHLRVFKPGYLKSGLADPFAYLIPEDATRIGRIESVPHVKSVAPRLAFNGLVSRGDSTISFIGEGVDPEKEQALSRSMTIVAGDGLSARDPKGIILGQGLADNLGAKPGDTVVLLVNTPRGGVNAVECRVRGLFATITKAYDDSALRVPIEVSRQLLRVSGSHYYAVLLDKTELADRAVAELRTVFRDQALEFVPWHQMADFYNKTAQLFRRQVDVVQVMIAFIIVLSISNSLMMSVMERTREIGTMMSLGTRRAGVLRLFLAEGALLGMFGGAIGLMVGWLSALAISAVGIPMPAAPGMAQGFTAEIMVTWPMAIQAFALAVITTVVASVYPAWKASRLEIVDALRHNR